MILSKLWGMPATFAFPLLPSISQWPNSRGEISTSSILYALEGPQSNTAPYGR